MDAIKLEIEVPKELHEVNVAVLNVLKAVKTALADGWQIGQDLPIIVTAAIANLPPAIDGFEKIADEVKENMPGTVNAGAFLAAEIIKIFKKG